MTTQQLKEKVINIKFIVSGTYAITIKYRNNEYTYLTNNMMAIDRIYEHMYCFVNDKENSGYYTYKEALQALWDEFKKKILKKKL